METRNIYYIDPNEDPLEIEVELALKRSMEENLAAYFEHIIAYCAMMGVDATKHVASREIYYLDEEE